MQVFELICELTHFDPYCEIMIKDKSGDLTNFKKSNLTWNGIENDKFRDDRYMSTELYITINKEIEDEK